jgi:hypothetical protein
LTSLEVVRVRGRIDFPPRRTDRKEQPMLDVILLAVGLGFFAIALAYVAGCERL